VAFQGSKGHRVASYDTNGDSGADALTGGNNTGEVERISRADRRQAHVWRGATNLAQLLDRLAEGELLAGHPGDESSTTNVAARLEPPVDACELAPRCGVRLAHEHFS